MPLSGAHGQHPVGEHRQVDGKFFDESDKALRAFQRSRGLGVDGICGPATRAALRKEA